MEKNRTELLPAVNIIYFRQRRENFEFTNECGLYLDEFPGWSGCAAAGRMAER